MSDKRFCMAAKAGSAELLAMFPWIARIGPNSGTPCEGHTYGHSPRRGPKPCRRDATFLYVMLDHSLRYYCRDHLDSNIIMATSYSSFDNFDEEDRCKRWFKKNMAEVS